MVRPKPEQPDRFLRPCVTCSAMGTPHPQIEWYREDSKVISCTRSQITNFDVDDTTVVSTLVISSVTVGDSGIYECRVKNDAGTTSHQYQVSVSECVCVYSHHANTAWCRLYGLLHTVASLSPQLTGDSDSVVSPLVTCVDAVTVHLRSQCSGACSDVQETAKVQS